MSSVGNSFNFDYRVSFTPQELEAGEVYYNYGMGKFPADEGPGISVFYRDEEGVVFHTYSSFARGLDMFLGVFHLLDITPVGRDEGQLPYPMSWVRHKDRYDDDSVVDPYA